MLDFRSSNPNTPHLFPFDINNTQQYQHQQYIKSPDLENFSHTLELLNRTNTFDNPPIRTSVTLWYENIKIFPILSSIYQNHLWICAQRNNFDQLLSRIVVSINANPDGNYPSQRVDIKRSQFETQFWRLQEISLLQEHLVANQLAVKVQFEDVINGKFPDNLLAALAASSGKPRLLAARMDSE